MAFLEFKNMRKMIEAIKRMKQTTAFKNMCIGVGIGKQVGSCNQRPAGVGIVLLPVD